jgi:hypothetical protein
MVLKRGINVGTTHLNLFLLLFSGAAMGVDPRVRTHPASAWGSYWFGANRVRKNYPKKLSDPHLCPMALY